MANDGTVLKPATEFDSRLKENVGLKTPVDINFVKANPLPTCTPEYVKENVVTKVIVSSLTSLDYCSHPTAFLSSNVKSSMRTLFKACLHSPINKITAIGTNLKARDIHCSDGIIFLNSDNGPNKAVEFPAGSIALISKQKKKENLVMLADRLCVPSAGTVAEVIARLQKYSQAPTDKYSNNNVKPDEVYFWDCENQPSFEAVVCANYELVHANECSRKAIISFQVEKDGFCLKGVNLHVIIRYSPGWQQRNSICLCDGNTFVSHHQRISKANL